jgi:hypothetical protein
MIHVAAAVGRGVRMVELLDAATTSSWRYTACSWMTTGSGAVRGAILELFLAPLACVGSLVPSISG